MSGVGQIFQLIPKVMKDVGAIGKDRNNADQKYKFRGIEDIYNAVHPALVANGVFCVPQVRSHESQDRVSKNGSPMIRVVMMISHSFYAPDGSSVEVITCGEGIDNSDKATNKAMSFAMKYAFVELLSLPFAQVDDGDSESPDAGARPLLNVPRTEVDIPIVPKNANGADKRAVAPPEDCITPEQASKLHIRFREALPADLQSKADVILYDWLGQQLYVDASGNPSAKAIRKDEFARVGKSAVEFAKEMNS